MYIRCILNERKKKREKEKKRKKDSWKHRNVRRCLLKKFSITNILCVRVMLIRADLSREISFESAALESVRGERERRNECVYAWKRERERERELCAMWKLQNKIRGCQDAQTWRESVDNVCVGSCIRSISSLREPFLFNPYIPEPYPSSSPPNSPIFSSRIFKSEHVGDETEETVIGQAAICLAKLRFRGSISLQDPSNEVAGVASMAAEGRSDRDEIFF